MPNKTQITPDIASASGESNQASEPPEMEEPDFEVELKMASRDVTLYVQEGENVALNTPDGDVFAYMNITEHNREEIIE